MCHPWSSFWYWIQPWLLPCPSLEAGSGSVQWICTQYDATRIHCGHGDVSWKETIDVVLKKSHSNGSQQIIRCLWCQLQNFNCYYTCRYCSSVLNINDLTLTIWPSQTRWPLNRWLMYEYQHFIINVINYLSIILIL